MSGIVVPVDEDVAHTARVLEQVLVALEDRLPGATRAADQAAAIARSAAKTRFILTGAGGAEPPEVEPRSAGPRDHSVRLGHVL